MVWDEEHTWRLGADVGVAAIALVLVVEAVTSEEWVTFLLVLMCTLLR
jgi:hypothetical protein